MLAVHIRIVATINKLANLEATLVETLPSDSLTGVKCRATSEAKNPICG